MESRGLDLALMPASGTLLTWCVPVVGLGRMQTHQRRITLVKPLRDLHGQVVIRLGVRKPSRDVLHITPFRPSA